MQIIELSRETPQIVFVSLILVCKTYIDGMRKNGSIVNVCNLHIVFLIIVVFLLVFKYVILTYLLTHLLTHSLTNN